MADSPEKETDLGTTDLSNRLVLLDPFIGFVLDERYEIVELIGTGGWGKVYKARHLTLNIDLAIKFVHQHHLNDEMSMKRFQQEAQLLSQIENPHIVRIIDHGLSPTPFIVMEYFSGVPLNNWIQSNGPMQWQRAIDLFIQLCDALAAAEALRIAHRDLKPANIMLKMDDETMQCKILDFGVAKFLDTVTASGQMTSTGEVLGSPAYMSPEQWSGLSDNRSDIYSLGCIMYEVLAAKPPFAAQYGIHYMKQHVSDKPPLIASFNPNANLPMGLEDVVRKCMEKSPAHRYQSSRECSADLIKLKAGSRPSITMIEKIKRRVTRKSLAGIALMIVTGATAYFWNESNIRKNAENLSMPIEVGSSDVVEKWKNKTLGEWTEAIEASPSNAELIYNRAILHLLRFEYGEAHRDLNSAIQVDPKFAEAYVERAIVCAANKDNNEFAKSLSDTNKAISLKPKFAHAYYARAVLNECMEQPQLVIADSNKAIELGDRGSEFEPGYMNVYENLSTAYVNLGRYGDAINAVNAGLKAVDPKYKWLLYRHRALVHYMRQEFSEAISDLTLATKESNCGPSVWSLMACCFVSLGDKGQADEACSKGMRFHDFETGPAAAYLRRAEFWRQSGMMDNAIHDASRAINLEKSKYYFSFRIRALCNISQGHFHQALTDLKEAVALNPFSAKTISLLAMVEDKLDENEKAQKDIARAFALPTHPPIAFVNRASIELHAGMVPEALADLNQTISLDPYLKEAYALRHEVDVKLGHKQEADGDAQLAARLMPHLEFFP